LVELITSDGFIQTFFGGLAVFIVANGFRILAKAARTGLSTMKRLSILKRWMYFLFIAASISAFNVGWYSYALVVFEEAQNNVNLRLIFSSINFILATYCLISFIKAIDSVFSNIGNMISDELDSVYDKMTDNKTGRNS